MAKLTRQSNVISHWYHPIENFRTPPLDFYTAIQEALPSREIPDLLISRVDWKEAGLLSARREYLRVQRGEMTFDICAAPFGTGFFFSWWLAHTPPKIGLVFAFFVVLGVFGLLLLLMQVYGFGGFFLWFLVAPAALGFAGILIREGHLGPGAEGIVLAMPIIGGLYERIFSPVTYYKMDTALMFQSAVHATVLQVMDQLTTSRGIRGLTELERKPIMRELVER